MDPRACARLMLLLLAGGALLAPPRLLAQSVGGAPPGGGAPGICSGGGCIPKAACNDGATLCSPFPEHPAYDPNVEFRKGADALRANDFAGARRAFDKVLYLAPTNPDVLYALGVADVGLGDLEGAASAFERALKWNPKLISAARDLALADLRLGRADKAARALAALKARAAACGAGCRDARALEAAVEAVETGTARSAR